MDAISPVDSEPLRRWGATPEEWAHFEWGLEVVEDLLPVVSNPDARLSPLSKIKTLGKVPSTYNAQRHVRGIPQWTSARVKPEQISAWSREPDYGICVQTRNVRAFDIDVTDPELASEIALTIERLVGRPLPRRFRENSSKLLLAFRSPGPCPKRILKTRAGNVELLGDGQQFVACGTHPSGARYQWLGGLPTEIPEVTREQLEGAL